MVAEGFGSDSVGHSSTNVGAAISQSYDHAKTIATTFNSFVNDKLFGSMMLMFLCY